MEVDENDVFDESLDPYDRSLDCEDDGIPDIENPAEDELDDSDDSWDSDWNDAELPRPESFDNLEDEDYESLED